MRAIERTAFDRLVARSVSHRRGLQPLPHKRTFIRQRRVDVTVPAGRPVLPRLSSASQRRWARLNFALF